MSKYVKRLYSQFQPKYYQLELRLDDKSMKFSGKVIIDGNRTGQPTNRLTFHQKGLKISNASVVYHAKKGEQKLAIERVNTHNSYDEVRLHTKSPVYPGKYVVELEFEGKITKHMNGLYPCFFKHDGQRKKLLATQFESHHAREVFPCIDEPEAKATFDLSITAPSGKTLLGNTPVKKSTTKGKLVRTTFETTPLMSTYLLAFVYGELEYLEAITKNGVVVRTYATPDNIVHTKFALDITVKILEFYNEYFALPYPLAKCDMIALPDFASGAMENWGCVTFREQALLVDEKNSTLANKQWVAMVIGHELAHQWFGNLVTMRWWTDLWLNEGFASWIEYLAVDKIYPEWQMWEQFTASEQQQALKLDALEHTHPIEVPVKHPDEIRSIFDVISYSKGASVIHMLHDYLGAEVFRDGLRHYLNQHKYSNTDTVDLWQALEDISGKPVKDFMHNWTSQSGYPLVNAKVTESKVTLTQERFFINRDHQVKDAQLWPIALLNKHLPERLDTAYSQYKVNDVHDFMLNTGQSGFYRVAYNSSHLERLGRQIRAGHVSAMDRLGILSDVFETAKAGKADTTDALHFLENFRNESDYGVWDVISLNLGNLRLVMGSEEVRDAMKPYTRKLVSKELKRLGWEHREDDSHFDRLLRPIILGQAAIAQEPSVVQRSRKLFDRIDEHTEDLKANLRKASTSSVSKDDVGIDPDMRGVVFGTIARSGNINDFQRLVKMHNASNLGEERNTLAAAITGFKQPELIKQALSMIDGEEVRLQDVAYWIAYSFMNRHARKLTWQWLKQHWTWMEENLGTDLSFYRTPIYVARVHSGQSFTKEYRSFFEPKLSPALERSYKQGLEILQWQSAWKNRDQKAVKNFFKRYA